MNKDEKYIARLIFKNKVYLSDGQSFENLFTKVMQAYDRDFVQIKPQGSLGDAKCDGFRKTSGEYYQVYAPEDLKGKQDKAFKKLEDSLVGMQSSWGSKGFDVKTVLFVINDKYKNTYASAHQNANTLTEKHSVNCKIFTCKDLEDIFLSLKEDSVIDIVGLIPDPINIVTVEYNVMNEVIQHVLSSPRPVTDEKIPESPNFDQKITFNELSNAVTGYLYAGQRQSFVIEEFFDLNSKFVKEELRISFNGLYNEAIASIPESKTKNDEVFQYILQKASPGNTYAIEAAVLVLMAHYFEYCDIFETPEV